MVDRKVRVGRFVYVEYDKNPYFVEVADGVKKIVMHVEYNDYENRVDIEIRDLSKEDVNNFRGYTRGNANIFKYGAITTIIHDNRVEFSVEDPEMEMEM